MAELELEAVKRLSQDLKQAAKTLTPQEARYFVDCYYQMQEFRKSASNQIRAMDKSGEPHRTADWLKTQFEILERSLKSVLGVYSQSQPAGRWAESICGIGPIISAGLLAHIDITKCTSAGDIWRFAGLDPTRQWNAGERRPWNARLKVLAFHIGESFVKVSGNPKDVYGKLLLARKQYESEKNERGEYTEQAAAKLKRFKISKDSEAYKHYAAGRLPPAHIHARAKRWAAKLFLAHWFEVAYELRYKKAGPAPYPIQFLGHNGRIPVPNWPRAVKDE
jgi:hypothetical protein